MTPSFLTTARGALRYLPANARVKDGPAGIQALAEDVDARLPIQGKVDPDGSSEGAGFTASYDSGTKTTTVTYDTPFPGDALPPLPIITARATNQIAAVNVYSTSGFQVIAAAPSTGTPGPPSFFFVVQPTA